MVAAAADAASCCCVLALLLVGALADAGEEERGGARAAAAGDAALRGDLRGRRGGDAAQHQRQVRRPVHPGAQPARPRP
jgi:hypothetical protein